MAEAFSSNYCTTSRHTTHYLAHGPEQGPLIIFIHGWPELSHSWRAQLAAFGDLGFRAVAPDMRGYGKSTVYAQHADYAQSEVVADMVELLDHLGGEQAIWVGHDWGSPTAWLMASHHPDKTLGVANLCVPYAVLENGIDSLVEFVDRNVYPEDTHPAGQWDYQLFYEENFDRATEVFAASPRNTLTALFRAWTEEGIGQPAITANVRAEGGWFGGLDQAPPMPLDTKVLSEEDLAVYVESLTRNGFFGPDSYYMNHAANADFSSQALNQGIIDLPALFLAARFDFVCETIDSRLAEPMRAKCNNLTEQIIDTGHWMAQEKPDEVNAALRNWITEQIPTALPS